MANITQLKHLEHIEDEMLNHGVDGCTASVSAMKEMLKMLGKKPSSGYMQTKWDGAPSVVCGKHPITGRFFVGTKSVFNKEPKLCHFDDDVDVYYSGDLATKLKTALQYFKPLGITGVIQGDLLFTEKDKKTVTVNNENLITFTPNTITYGVPVNSDMGKKISTAKIGVVFHTHYNGDDLSSMTASAGAPTSEFSKTTDCVVIENDTPIADVAVPTNTLQLFERNTNTIESMCKKSGKFLNTLVDNMGTSGDKKFHIASYLKQFFNNEIKEGRSINDSQKAIKSIGEFYRTKMNKEVEKMKSVQKQAERRKQMYDGMAYLEDNITEFDAMFTLYRKMQENKEIVIKALDNLETFRTFVQTDKGYKVTGPEGYVLHHDGDMIKLVNRIEFSYNNFTLAKQWR
tara:strand:- start:1672 stop:2874 length:1203 start_codon:yes stop_codon:yes gene_type:complete